mmetsp:Transcript_17439/g.49523  ORF Transcript_17439/g.49523 Transcript_17439/m.49523 type:complete len:212 (-) Transcript_17439:21-656(-)
MLTSLFVPFTAFVVSVYVSSSGAALAVVVEDGASFIQHHVSTASSQEPWGLKYVLPPEVAPPPTMFPTRPPYVVTALPAGQGEMPSTTMATTMGLMTAPPRDISRLGSPMEDWRALTDYLEAEKKELEQRAAELRDKQRQLSLATLRNRQSFQKAIQHAKAGHQNQILSHATCTHSGQELREKRDALSKQVRKVEKEISKLQAEGPAGIQR